MKIIRITITNNASEVLDTLEISVDDKVKEIAVRPIAPGFPQRLDETYLVIGL